MRRPFRADLINHRTFSNKASTFTNGAHLFAAAKFSVQPPGQHLFYFFRSNPLHLNTDKQFPRRPQSLRVERKRYPRSSANETTPCNHALIELVLDNIFREYINHVTQPAENQFHVVVIGRRNIPSVKFTAGCFMNLFSGSTLLLSFSMLLSLLAAKKILLPPPQRIFPLTRNRPGRRSQ